MLIIDHCIHQSLFNIYDATMNLRFVIAWRSAHEMGDTGTPDEGPFLLYTLFLWNIFCPMSMWMDLHQASPLFENHFSIHYRRVFEQGFLCASVFFWSHPLLDCCLNKDTLHQDNTVLMPSSYSLLNKTKIHESTFQLLALDQAGFLDEVNGTDLHWQQHKHH